MIETLLDLSQKSVPNFENLQYLQIQNFWEMFGNACLAFGNVLEYLQKFSESAWKSWYMYITLYNNKK